MTAREKQLYQQLAAIECFCGNPKEPRRTFCKRCYYKLPPRMRSPLYQKLGEGYERAVDEAEALLRGRLLREKGRDGK